MLEGFFEWCQGLGPAFTLLGLFAILLVDSIIFPALPELFTVIAFLMDPTPEWAAVLLSTVCLAEVAGNSLLYSLVRWKRLPEFAEKAMKKWVAFIVLQDERIILLNRIAPVMPFTGAFMATCGWNYRRSMLYLLVGGLLKYSGLLALVYFFDYTFDPGQAQLFSIAAVVIIIVLSIAASAIYRKRHGAGGTE